MTRPIDKSCAITRTNSPALDAILGHSYPVLDHGFCRVIDYMGDDVAIVQMARTSYGQGTKSTSDDRGLIRYLMRHHHTSPMEGCEIKLHLKMPIFVARQWIRHRTAALNEVSGRYSVLSGEFYFPDAERLGRQSVTNKQGTGQSYDAATAEIILDQMDHAVDGADSMYRFFISPEAAENPADSGYDLSRELARIILPQNIYTEMYWKIDLHNLFHFLRLRADAHAQWEIRQYADLICSLVALWVPHAYGAWVDYRKEAVTFSRMEMEAIREMATDILNIGVVPNRPDGMTDREVKEFHVKMGWTE